MVKACFVFLTASEKASFRRFPRQTRSKAWSSPRLARHVLQITKDSLLWTAVARTLSRGFAAVGARHQEILTVASPVTRHNTIDWWNT